MTRAGDWFEAAPFGRHLPDGGRRVEAGLRFACTQCGACCSGPPGTVVLSEAEAHRLARRLGLPTDQFLDRYTTPTADGPSLVERLGPHGHDCVFLDRASVPGRAVCGVYQDRPNQCRTWPFWKATLGDPRAWARAAARCPGMNQGPLTPARVVRLTRDASPV